MCDDEGFDIEVALVGVEHHRHRHVAEVDPEHEGHRQGEYAYVDSRRTAQRDGYGERGDRQPGQ